MTSNEPDSPQQRPNKPTDEDWGEDWGVQDAAPEQVEGTESLDQDLPVLQLPPRRESKQEEPERELEEAPPGQAGVERAKRVAPMRPSEEGRLERMAATLEQAPFEPANIEEKDWAQSTGFRPGWLLLISAAIVVLIVSCLIVLQRNSSDDSSAAKDGKDGKGAQKSAGLVALETELQELFGRQEEARKVYSDFASSQVVEEILPLIRNSGELQELIRRTGHQRLVDKEWRPQQRAKWEPFLLRGKPFACLTGELPDFTPFKAYFILEDEALLLDWKATTAYSTSAFSDLAQGRGDGSEVRGIMKSASLYTAVWPETEYFCYQLESPDKREMLWCYVKRSSDVADLLGKFFLKGQIVEEKEKVLPMTLKLKRGPEGSLPNQWLIEQVHHEEWIKM